MEFHPTGKVLCWSSTECGSLQHHCKEGKYNKSRAFPEALSLPFQSLSRSSNQGITGTVVSPSPSLSQADASLLPNFECYLKSIFKEICEAGKPLLP